jgi:hypothetical protein
MARPIGLAVLALLAPISVDAQCLTTNLYDAANGDGQCAGLIASGYACAEYFAFGTPYAGYCDAECAYNVYDSDAGAGNCDGFMSMCETDLAPGGQYEGYCDFACGYCGAEPAVVGAACTEDADCESLFCDGGSCADDPSSPRSGEAVCENHGFDEGTCLSQGCCHWDADTSACSSSVGSGPCSGSPAPAPADSTSSVIGAACTEDADCQSSYCNPITSQCEETMHCTGHALSIVEDAVVAAVVARVATAAWADQFTTTGSYLDFSTGTTTRTCALWKDISGGAIGIRGGELSVTGSSFVGNTAVRLAYHCG